MLLKNLEDGDELLARLHEEKELVLCGTDREELNANDYLKGNGVEVCSFIGIQKMKNMDTLCWGKDHEFA